MQIRTIIVTAAALGLLPWSASADGMRILSSGKLDASNSYDFSCSVVNKNDPAGPYPPIDVTLKLKDAAGNVYIDPQTFQPAELDAALDIGEAAMLVAPAAFVGVTSLYCWAEVPKEATVFGTHSVRDAQDRATAATPLAEDVNKAALTLKGKLDDIHEKLEGKNLPGPVTGLDRRRFCGQNFPTPDSVPGGGVLTRVVLCPDGQLASGGGCGVNEDDASENFNNWRSIPIIAGANENEGWRCAWRNQSTTTEQVEACAYAVCVDAHEPVQ